MRNCFSETTRKNAERQQREVLYGGWSVNVFRTFWQINKRSVVFFLSEEEEEEPYLFQFV